MISMKIIAFTGAGISKQSNIPTFMERPDIREKLFRDYANTHHEEYNEVIRHCLLYTSSLIVMVIKSSTALFVVLVFLLKNRFPILKPCMLKRNLDLCMMMKNNVYLFYI